MAGVRARARVDRRGTGAADRRPDPRTLQPARVMANYRVNRAKCATLFPSTLDTIPFPAFGTYSAKTVKVINRHTTNPIFFVADGSTPTVAGDDCYCVPPGGSAVITLSCRAGKRISWFS